MAVYIIGFAEAISGHASYYVGWAKDVDKRFYWHTNGRGARLTQVACQRGIPFELIAVFPYGDKAFERRLKRYKKTSQIVEQIKRGKKTVLGQDVVISTVTHRKEVIFSTGL